MIVTPFYAALFGVGLIWLSIKVIEVRRKDKVSLGVADNEKLERRVRAHANYCEFVPLGLVLIYFVEITWKLPALTHLIGLSLLLGRAAHARAFLGERMFFKWRVWGMLLTFFSIGAASVALLAYAAKGLL